MQRQMGCIISHLLKKEEKMTKITSLDLSPFYRTTIGMDRLFDRVMNQVDTASANGNYPPYNIARIDENRYEIQVAVAGFDKEEIDISYHEGHLTVSGSQEDKDRDIEYLYHGISSRNFSRSFTLAEYVEVNDAVIENGILTISLERIVPESMKPKSIAITQKD